MTPAEVPDAFVARVAQIESGGNPQAVNRASSAVGLFQFIDSTWAGLRREHPELGLTARGRMDPEQATLAFRQFAADNARTFQLRLGRLPAFSEWYLCHFLGVRTCAAVITAAPEALVAKVAGPAVVKANGFRPDMTCAALRAWARNKVPDTLPIPTPVLVGADALNAAQLAKLKGQTA